MPVEAAKSPTSNPVPLADANAQNTPKKKQAVGKAALAKVTLLDGSVLDVTIDVSVIKIHANLVFPFQQSWNESNLKKFLVFMYSIAAKGKRKRFNQFDLCRFEYYRKRLFWTIVFDANWSACMAWPRETSGKILQNRSMDIAIRREILSTRAGPIAGGHYALPFVSTGQKRYSRRTFAVLVRHARIARVLFSAIGIGRLRCQRSQRSCIFAWI